MWNIDILKFRVFSLASEILKLITDYMEINFAFYIYVFLWFKQI